MAETSDIKSGAERTRVVEELYRDAWGDLCRFIQSRFGSGPPEPEEVAQAAFARLVNLPSLDGIDNPKGFLFTVATNIVRDHHRRATYRDGVHRDMQQTSGDLALSEVTPENVIDSRQRMAAFKVALAAMPDARRRVFLLVRVEGLTVGEVARRFGMTEGAVYKHVSRAMNDCIVALDGMGS